MELYSPPSSLTKYGPNMEIYPPSISAQMSGRGGGVYFLGIGVIMNLWLGKVTTFSRNSSNCDALMDLNQSVVCTMPCGSFGLFWDRKTFSGWFYMWGGGGGHGSVPMFVYINLRKKMFPSNLWNDYQSCVAKIVCAFLYIFFPLRSIRTNDEIMIFFSGTTFEWKKSIRTVLNFGSSKMVQCWFFSGQFRVPSKFPH